MLEQAWVDPAAEKAVPVVHRSEHEHSKPFILSKFIVRPAGLVNTLLLGATSQCCHNTHSLWEVSRRAAGRQHDTVKL